MAKFTPGPWALSKAKYSPDMKSKDGKIICTFWLEVDDNDSFCDDPEVLANARLIATAPEMYTWIRILLDQIDLIDNTDAIPDSIYETCDELKQIIQVDGE